MACERFRWGWRRIVSDHMTLPKQRSAFAPLYLFWISVPTERCNLHNICLALSRSPQVQSCSGLRHQCVHLLHSENIYNRMCTFCTQRTFITECALFALGVLWTNPELINLCPSRYNFRAEKCTHTHLQTVHLMVV